jgi:CRISPR system Cascade subunit CasB
MNTTTPVRPLIPALEAWRDNRAVLANLRRGLGEPRSMAPAMHPYLLPLIPAGATRWQEQSHYLIAALYALHPKNATEGNLGHHFNRAVAQAGEGGGEAIERRFVALLDAHPEDLAFHLRQAVSFLKSKEEIPINWQRLFYDVLAWNHDLRRGEVQRQWATGFWRRATREEVASVPTTAR